MTRKNKEYWNNVHKKIKKHHYTGIMHEFKQFFYLVPIMKYNLNFKKGNILVTDLFDEGFNCDNLFAYYSKINKNTFGVDISDVITSRVGRRFKNSSIVNCDIVDLPFKNKFNLIVSPSTLDHMPIDKLLDTIIILKKSLKKGGYMYLTFHNKKNIWFHHQILKKIRKINYKHFLFEEKEIQSICKKARLKIIAKGGINHLPIPLITTKFMPLLKLLQPKTRKGLFNLIESLGNFKTRFLTSELIYFILKNEKN